MNAINCEAEFGEDRFLLSHFPGLFDQPGAYLDIGCGPPASGSNSHFLRCLGWAGVGIDANPDYALQWEKATDLSKTRFIAAILSPAALVKFTFAHNCPGWSRIGSIGGLQERWFGATRLDELCRQSRMPPVDFLSIDLEGAEYDVLVESPRLYSDIAEHRAKVIIAEHSTAQSNGTVTRDERVKALLLLHGYRMVLETVANYVFIRGDLLPSLNP